MMYYQHYPMKNEEINKCEFCCEIKPVQRYCIRIKNKHFDDNKQGKYHVCIYYCNDCGIDDTSLLHQSNERLVEDTYKEALNDMFFEIANLAEPDERQPSAGDLNTNMDFIHEIRKKLLIKHKALSDVRKLMEKK